MEITVEHVDGIYPSFNVMLHSVKGAEPFLTIKGCRTVTGANGAFVSYPAKKLESGKYWNHVYGGEKFNAAVLAAAEKAMRPAGRKHDAARARELDDDVPF